MKFIKNIKISVEFLSHQPLTHFFDVAAKRDVCCTLKRNILIIKDNFSINVFKKLNGNYHFNITGIRVIDGVDAVIVWLRNTYCNKTDFCLISHRIDNITAAFDVGCFLNLDVLAANIHNSSYNPERFHALYIKNVEHIKGTIVLFQTGKINIIGTNSVENVLLLWKFIKEKIDAVMMK